MNGKVEDDDDGDDDDGDDDDNNDGDNVEVKLPNSNNDIGAIKFKAEIKKIKKSLEYYRKKEKKEEREERKKAEIAENPAMHRPTDTTHSANIVVDD